MHKYNMKSNPAPDIFTTTARIFKDSLPAGKRAGMSGMSPLL